MFAIYITDSAASDLEEIWDFHFLKAGEVVASDLIDDMLGRLNVLAAQPRSGRERPELGSEVRALILDSYLAFYMLDARTVTILRILHGARDVDRIMKNKC